MKHPSCAVMGLVLATACWSAGPASAAKSADTAARTASSDSRQRQDQPAAGVANDRCEEATVIESVPFAPPPATTTDATTDQSDPLQSCTFDGPDRNSNSVWYAYTPSCPGVLTVRTCGSSYDTVLTAYTRDCGDLTEVACNDDACDVQSEINDLQVEEGRPLLMEVTQYGSPGGGSLEFHLDVDCDEPPEQPSNPFPADGAEAVPLDTVLSWNTLGLAAGHGTPKVIYGNDDRLDEYEVTDPILTQLGDSTVVVVFAADLVDRGDGTFSLPAATYGEFYDLCPDERFYSQPAPGFCSGFLVSGQTIATAGHCITNFADCAGTAFVFGFVMSDGRSPALMVEASQVYYCSRIIARQEAEADWCLARLDRPVPDHSPLALRTSGKIPDDEPLLVISYPSGLPRKYAAGASVRDNTDANTFEANLDVYGGSSGGAVFSADSLLVEGILVEGEEDFIYQPPPDNCWVSNTCPDDGCLGEAVTRTTEFADLVPMLEYDVYFGPCDDLEHQVTTQLPTWDPAGLDALTTYCWQIVARNDFGETTGPQWSFTTITGPTDPKVEPPSLDFGDSDASLTFDVWNAADGPWEFEVTAEPDWLSASPTTGSSAGPSDRTTVTVTVDRAGLDPGGYSGTVSVGEATVEVTMTVAAPPRPTCQPESLDFGDSETSLTIEAWNQEEGLWEFEVTADQGWLSVSPADGSSTGPTDRTTITVTINRGELDAGTYDGTVSAGECTVAVTMEVAAEITGRGSGSGGGGLCGAIGLVGLPGTVLGFLLLCRLPVRGVIRRRPNA